MNMKIIRKNLKKSICLILVTLLIITFVPHQSLADEPQPAVQGADVTNNQIDLYSRADILLDSKTGNVLYENHSNEKLYPASTTKLMTAILTIENCKMTDTVTIKPEWLGGIPTSYTIANLQSGETLTINQLMHVLLIPSANDAANVLACHISGSVDKFADKMNNKAKELGCKNTHFVNPSGIHNDDHYSTAYDMALIGLYASKYSEIREIVTNITYSLPNLPDGKPRTFKATNTLINQKSQYYYEYATGLKTGYTDKAKSCIVATAKKDDIELLCVVLGGDKTENNKAQRELDCKTLFEYGFNNFKYMDICTKNESIDISQVANIPDYLNNKNLIYENTLNVLTPIKGAQNPTILFEVNKKLPIMKNTIVGTITYHIQGNDYTINILSGEDILPENTESTQTIYYILIAMLIILLIISIVQKRKRRKKRALKYYRHSFY